LLPEFVAIWLNIADYSVYAVLWPSRPRVRAWLESDKTTTAIADRPCEAYTPIAENRGCCHVLA